MDDNIFIYFVDLPDGIHEMVTPCADGYTIYIDARMDREHQLRAYEHAVFHIEHNDFAKDNVQQIEAEAHGITPLVPEKTAEEIRLERIRKNSQIRLKKLQRSKKKRRKEMKDRQEFIDFLMTYNDRYYAEHHLF